ncbi:hypothetical protein [Chryseobacterium echinoideorum]|uniref:hypothetical protein n=1 Tax=Chryseobacterium echinoideorum TaxID=1549648 RepID=UPI0011849A5E|nr:hypothetical protein [Chryseobacterium echinoideorum]
MANPGVEYDIKVPIKRNVITKYFLNGKWTDGNDNPIKETTIGETIRFNVETDNIDDGEKINFTIYDWDFFPYLEDKLTLTEAGTNTESKEIVITGGKGFVEWTTGEGSRALLDENFEGDELELYVECVYNGDKANLPKESDDYLILYEKEVLITVIVELPMENYDYSGMSTGQRIVAKAGLLGHTAIGIDKEYYDYGPEQDKSILQGNISETKYGDLNNDGDTTDIYNGIDDPTLKDSGLNQGSYGDPLGTLGRPWWDYSYSSNGDANLNDIMTILNSDSLRKQYGVLGEVHIFEIEVKESQAKIVKEWWENKYNKNLGLYSVNIMENGEHCTSTVHDSLVEAKIIRRLPYGTICTPSSFLIT